MTDSLDAPKLPVAEVAAGVKAEPQVGGLARAPVEGLGGEPPLGELGEGGLAGVGIDVGAPEHVGSEGDDEALGVLLACEGVGALVTVGFEVVSVPALVVAETVRGGAADAQVKRVLKAAGEVDVADEPVGRTAGRLLGSAGSAATVDAVVVATAVEAGGAVILTGDADDLGLLAAGEPTVIIESGYLGRSVGRHWLLPQAEAPVDR